MRTTMGKRIDGLNDEERDRLITAREMNDGMVWHDSPECGCLEGTISLDCRIPEHIMDAARAAVARARVAGIMGVPWRDAPPSIRYPKAVHRFGKARVVRAVKLRAAKGHRIILPAPQHTEHATT